VAACDEDGGVTTANRPPLAFVRYVNAVHDTSALDFKFIDAIEYSPMYTAMTFRSIGVYQGAEAGTRDIRVFANSSTIGVTSVPLVDTTLTLVAGNYYTILHIGSSRAADGAATADRLVLVDDTRPAQDAGIHVSTLNATAAAIDVSVAAATGDAWVTTSGNVGVGARSAYTARAVGAMAVRVGAVGANTTSHSVASFTGAAGTVSVDPVGGNNVAGTQFSAMYFPASTAGSPAPAGFTTPALSILVDRQPPRTVPD
jgi:hypothetical protein